MPRIDRTELSANHAFYDTFRTTAKLVVGEPLYQLAEGARNVPALKGPLERVLASDEVVTAAP